MPRLQHRLGIAAEIELIAGLAPASPPVVAVIVWDVTVALVLNVICAAPVPSVVAGFGPVNEPPLVLLNVTALPAVATGLLFASASCARIVTDVPATGVRFVDVTTYVVAAPAWKATRPGDVIATEFTVAPMVAVPAVVEDVRLTV